MNDKYLTQIVIDLGCVPLTLVLTNQNIDMTKITAHVTF